MIDSDVPLSNILGPLTEVVTPFIKNVLTPISKSILHYIHKHTTSSAELGIYNKFSVQEKATLTI